MKLVVSCVELLVSSVCDEGGWKFAVSIMQVAYVGM